MCTRFSFANGSEFTTGGWRKITNKKANKSEVYGNGSIYIWKKDCDDAQTRFAMTHVHILVYTIVTLHAHLACRPDGMKNPTVIAQKHTMNTLTVR